MPYIHPSLRPPIDEKVDELADVLATLNNGEGATNYAITRLLLHAWKATPRYAQLNAIIGVLECVKLEFYRQLGVPYEETKREENGPVQI